MRYMLLIYGEELDVSQFSQEEIEKGLEAHMTYYEGLGKSGVMQSADRLMSSSSATTLRVRAGEALVTDGPFAETKEQIGGIYILDCENLDDVIELAAKNPSALSGAIEIRPIMEAPIEAEL